MNLILSHKASQETSTNNRFCYVNDFYPYIYRVLWLFPIWFGRKNSMFINKHFEIGIQLTITKKHFSIQLYKLQIKK